MTLGALQSSLFRQASGNQVLCEVEPVISSFWNGLLQFPELFVCKAECPIYIIEQPPYSITAQPLLNKTNLIAKTNLGIKVPVNATMYCCT